MKVSTHVVVQALMIAAQFLNFASGVVPPKYQPFVMLALSASQGAIAWFNHYYGPDGKPLPPVA